MERLYDVRNAKITNVSLSMADHGCLTFWLTVEGGGFGCGVGGYCIGHGHMGAKNFSASAKGLEAMMRIMNVVGVPTWEELKGKYCRVVVDGNTIHEIGNLISDEWFDLRTFFGEEE